MQKHTNHVILSYRGRGEKKKQPKNHHNHHNNKKTKNKQKKPPPPTKTLEASKCAIAGTCGSSRAAAAVLQPHQHPTRGSGHSPESRKSNCYNFCVTVSQSEGSRTHFRLCFGFDMISNCWLVGNKERMSASSSHIPRGKNIFAEQLISNWQIISEVPYFSCMQILTSNYACCVLDLQLSFALHSLEASSS